jgi:diadenosine tetraphosphate (Ap4A) HIT family hydrolase
MDLGQFHPGHTLVLSKRHIVDIYGLDKTTGGVPSW